MVSSVIPARQRAWAPDPGGVSSPDGAQRNPGQRKTRIALRSIRATRSGSPRNDGAGNAQKKSRRFRRLLKLITGRRQTEWTGATRCPNKDDLSHKRESLINRKRAILFKLHLPCRPMTDITT